MGNVKVKSLDDEWPAERKNEGMKKALGQEEGVDKSRVRKRRRRCEWMYVEVDITSRVLDGGDSQNGKSSTTTATLRGTGTFPMESTKYVK